jgi:prepilin-type N-terminal cleavage/methylation domain-containing protein
MEFKLTNRKTAGSAFTLPEMIVSVALLTLLLLGGTSFYVFTLSSFASMTNYTELNNQSRNASDLISRDIRAALSVASATSNQLVLSAFDGTNVTYNFNSAASTLTRTKGGDSRTLLKGISSFAFSLYQRPSSPAAAYEQFPAATAASAKFVAFQWSCSRRVSGPQNDSEAIEMALVELRNQ